MSRKKILLIAPKNPVISSSSLPPLGLITVASHIPNKYSVRLIDETKEPIRYDCDIVLISANSITIKRAYQLCMQFKEKKIPVVLGGIHSSLLPEEASKYATSVIVGNGEGIIAQVLEDIEKGKPQKIYRPNYFDLSKSKKPRRDLLKYYPVGSLETSRGCPLNCEFCSVTEVNGAMYRYKPIEVVRDELDSIKKKNIFLVDDNMLGVGEKAEKRAIELLKLFKEYNINWFGQVSINIADKPKVLKLAQESGAMVLYIGFESLNEKFLKSSNKVLNLKKGTKSYKKTINTLHDYGINVMGSFIYGTDFDTKNSIMKLKEFVRNSDIDTTDIKPLTPLPGTRLYYRYKEANRLFNNNYWLMKKYPLFTFKPRFLTIDDMYDITKDLLNLYTFPRSLRKFFRSVATSKNLKASAISFYNNYSDYRSYRKYFNNFTP